MFTIDYRWDYRKPFDVIIYANNTITILKSIKIKPEPTAMPLHSHFSYAGRQSSRTHAISYIILYFFIEDDKAS